jgi:hypothetical protein
MATSSSANKPPETGRLSVRPKLSVTRYEEVAAALVTALILVGALVTLLFLMWLTTRVWVRPAAVEPQLIEPLSGGGNALSGERDLAEPGDEVLDELEPQLEERIDALTEVVSTQQAQLDTLTAQSDASSRGQGSGGPAGEGDADQIPRWLRWELRFRDSTIVSYARQLDWLGIELAAVGGGRDTIDFAYNLSKNPPDRRSAERDDRIYFRWTRDDRLRTADLELLKRAGIPTEGRLILKFIPPKLENDLALLEDAAMKAKRMRLEDLQRTVFAVVPGGDGFQIRVVEVHSR